MAKPFNITPTPSRQHQDVLMALASKFYNFLEDKSCEVYVAPFDVRLPEADQPKRISPRWFSPT